MSEMPYVKMLLKLADFPETERVKDGKEKYANADAEFDAAQKFFGT